MTGKSNLTYQEAQESEEQARKLLKGFPQDLKVPILYMASLTKRTSFGDMAEDVFCYTKDQYFAGENIEASFTNNKWKDCHILSVIAPDEKLYKHEILTNGWVFNRYFFFCTTIPEVTRIIIFLTCDFGCFIMQDKKYLNIITMMWDF